MGNGMSSLPPPPPAASRPPPKDGGRAPPWTLTTGVAFWASVIGWVVLGFVEAVERFTGEEVSVRDNDLGLLATHSVVIGFAMVGLVVAGRGFRRQRLTKMNDPGMRLAAGLSVCLVFASVLLWIAGNLGDWEPDRPFPYEPVAASQANLIMTIGVLVGASVGSLLPLGKSARAVTNNSAALGG